MDTLKISNVLIWGRGFLKQIEIMNSSRKYIVVGFEGGTEAVNETLTLFQLLKNHLNGFEYIYAIQEETDKILDLKVGESMFVPLSRDNSNFKGIIARIS